MNKNHGFRLAAALLTAATMMTGTAGAQDERDRSWVILAADSAQSRAQRAQGTTTDPGTRHYREAWGDMQRRSFADAAVSFQAAIARARSNPLYYGGLALANFFQGRPDAAADAFSAAATLQATNAWYIVALAAVRATQEDWPQAAGALELAVRTDSSIVDGSLAALAAEYFEQAGDRERANEWAVRGTQLMPDNANLWLRVASYARARNDTTAGLAAVRRFLQLRPGDRLGTAIYATFLFETGRNDSAIALASYAAADSNYRAYAAEVLLAAAVRMLQARDVDRSALVLRQGLPWADSSLVPTYRYYLGRAQLQQLVSRMSVAEERRNCDATRGLDTLMAETEGNLRAGIPVDSVRAEMFVTQVIPGYRQNLETMTRNWCRQQPAAPRRRP